MILMGRDSGSTKIIYGCGMSSPVRGHLDLSRDLTNFTLCVRLQMTWLTSCRRPPERQAMATDFTVGHGATIRLLVERLSRVAAGAVTAALDLMGTGQAMEVSVALVGDRARVVTIAAFAQGVKACIKVIGGAPGAGPGHRDPQRRAPAAGPARPRPQAERLCHPDFPAHPG
jgi:hypothetical protein